MFPLLKGSCTLGPPKCPAASLLPGRVRPLRALQDLRLELGWEPPEVGWMKWGFPDRQGARWAFLQQVARILGNSSPTGERRGSRRPSPERMSPAGTIPVPVEAGRSTRSAAEERPRESRSAPPLDLRIGVLAPVSDPGGSGPFRHPPAPRNGPLSGSGPFFWRIPVNQSKHPRLEVKETPAQEERILNRRGEEGGRSGHGLWETGQGNDSGRWARVLCRSGSCWRYWWGVVEVPDRHWMWPTSCSSRCSPQ